MTNLHSVDLTIILTYFGSVKMSISYLSVHIINQKHVVLCFYNVNYNFAFLKIQIFNFSQSL